MQDEAYYQDKLSINSALSKFCRLYNIKNPKEKITIESFNLLHEFTSYLIELKHSQELTGANR